MTRRSDIPLWVGAFGASIALHGALAATLALAPKPQPVEPSETNIAIQWVTSDMPDKVAATPAPQAEAKREHVENVSTSDAAAPVESGAAATEITAAGESMTAVSDSDTAAPVESGEVVAELTATGESVTAVEPTGALEPVRDLGIMSPAQEQSALIAGTETTEAARQVTRKAEQLSAARVEQILVGTPRPVDEAPAIETARVEVVAPAITVPELEPEPAPASVAQPVLSSGNAASQDVSVPVEIARAAPAVVGEPSSPGATRPLTAVVASSQTAGPVAALPSERSPIAPIAPAVQALADVQVASKPEEATPAPVISNPPPLAAVPATAPGADAAADVREPEGSNTQVAMLPVRPPRPVMEARPLVDPLQQVRNVIAGQPEAACFLALALPSPQMIEVDGYSETPARLQQLHDDLATIADTSVRTRQHRITAAQCEALSFARSLSPDPVARLPITSASAEISSGAELSGAVHNFSRKWLYLVVVDDEGTVQELDDLSRNEDGTIGFRAPLTLTDGPVDTVQLLLAVASDNALETFAQREGENARPYFAALATEISALRQSVEIGIAGFIIR